MPPSSHSQYHTAAATRSGRPPDNPPSPAQSARSPRGVRTSPYVSPSGLSRNPASSERRSPGRKWDSAPRPRRTRRAPSARRMARRLEAALERSFTERTRQVEHAGAGMAGAAGSAWRGGGVLRRKKVARGGRIRGCCFALDLGRLGARAWQEQGGQSGRACGVSQRGTRRRGSSALQTQTRRRATCARERNGLAGCTSFLPRTRDSPAAERMAEITAAAEGCVGVAGRVVSG